MPFVHFALTVFKNSRHGRLVHFIGIGCRDGGCQCMFIAFVAHQFHDTRLRVSLEQLGSYFEVWKLCGTHNSWLGFRVRGRHSSGSLTSSPWIPKRLDLHLCCDCLCSSGPSHGSAATLKSPQRDSVGCGRMYVMP